MMEQKQKLEGRGIKLFHEHLLIHSNDDGSGSMKYSVCDDDNCCGCEKSATSVHQEESMWEKYLPVTVTGILFIAGMVNLNQVMEVRVVKAYDDRSLARVLEMVQGTG